MENGKIIIGIFVKRNKILSFLEFLRHNLGISINKVFVFNVDGNIKEYLVTFSSPKMNQYLSRLHDATMLHVKNGCLFSINALNKYIEYANGNNYNNIEYNVDWDKLKDTLLITTNGILKHSKLFKIRDKCNLILNLG